MDHVGLLTYGVGSRAERFGARFALGLTAAMTVVLVGSPFVVRGVTELPVLLFVVPVAACAVRFGLRGGLAAAFVGTAIAALWYFHERHFAGGALDLLAHASGFVLVGGLVGSYIDRRRELEEVLSSHQELCLDLICTASFDGYFTRINPAWTRVLGHEPRVLLERPFIEFVHPDDRQATLDEVERQTRAGLPVLNFQNRYRTADGSYRWLEWMSRPDPERQQLIAVARDVTARHEAEEAVANYRAQLEAAVQHRTVELEEARVETLQRLALAAEYRDDDTHQHTERVGHTAALLAAELGLPGEFADLIRRAAPLHDVGKLAISDTILLKPGRLTTDEFKEMQRHTLAGAQLLSGSNSEVLKLGEEIAMTHHERWDGTGYPHRLHEEQIPLSGRIVAVADVFDALTHERPYKNAWSVQQAVQEILRLAGRQFDPQIVEAFARVDHSSLLVTPQRHLRAVAG